MTPILQTSDRLILRSRPWKLALGLIAAMLIFAAIGISKVTAKDMEEAGKVFALFAIFTVAFLVFARQKVVTFDRQAGTFDISTLSALGRRRVQHPLAGLKRADAQPDPNPSPDRRGTAYRLALTYLDGTEVLLSSVYSTGDDSLATAKTINKWLNNRKT